MSTLRPLHPIALAVAALSLPAAWADDTLSAPPERVVVTGNPLGRDGIAQPSQALGGDRLSLQRAATLGQTLDGLPGVASTWFGPNASRPSIRGLDGDRVRLLDNSGASVDASSLSFDHAVAIDPLVVERVEVLRGPAALLYGGNATGGVVNTLDNRIPRQPLDELSGRAELRLGGAADERSLSALVEGGAGGFSWHADAFGRRSSDLRVPRYTPVEDGTPGEPTRRVRNSAAEGEGGAIGASWADAAGHVGLSADSFANRYGVTVEPDVTIRMRRERLALSAERQLSAGPITGFNLRASDTRYRHQEVEGDGAVGTTFDSRGQDLRVEARHAPIAGVQGVVGLQAESLRFSALGEEAFVPGTRTESAALFLLEEGEWAGWSLGAGARVESVRVRSSGDAADADEPRFGDAMTRRFTPGSLSLSARRSLGAGWQASAMLAHVERAPAYYELYANGVHLATGAYERGDSALGTERGLHLDLGVAWQQGTSSLKAHAWQMRFDRYIALDATGLDIEVPDEDGGTSVVPEYRFQAVPARLWGAEVEGRHRLWANAGFTLDGRASLDLVRGVNRATDEPLPRLAPMRATLALEAAQGPWGGGIEWRHAAAQTRVPDTDITTPGWNIVNLWASHQWAWSGMTGFTFVRVDNVGDTLAYSASAIRMVRELAPLPGRSFSAGVRVGF
jgi:iron complex outermembrane recepter protein